MPVSLNSQGGKRERERERENRGDDFTEGRTKLLEKGRKRMNSDAITGEIPSVSIECQWVFSLLKGISRNFNETIKILSSSRKRAA